MKKGIKDVSMLALEIWRELIYFTSILLNSSVLSDYKDRSREKEKRPAPVSSFTKIFVNVTKTRYPETRRRMEGK